jgi:hypothetical protein
MRSIYELAVASPVHQILLTNGALDVVPTQKIDSMKEIFRGRYTLWTEEKIVEVLKDNFDPRVLEAYRSIKPLAFKADLARYCIVYVHGGWYFDILLSIQDTAVLKEIDESHEAILFRDIPFTDVSITIANTLFWFKNPKHEILENLINQVVDNILSKNYGPHAHSVTGPIAFGREVAKYQIKNPGYTFAVGDTVMINNRPSHGFNIIALKDFKIFSNRRGMDEEYPGLLPSGYETGSRYFELWRKKDIFK